MWIEQTTLAQWVGQGTTIWAYPTILFLHTLALAVVVGITMVISLRVLNITSGIALRPLAGLFPLLWAGFILSAISGGLLFITDVDARLANGYFVTKMVFVVLAAISTALLRRVVFTDRPPDPQQLPRIGRVLALSSIVFWIGAITAGRLIAYLSPV